MDNPLTIIQEALQQAITKHRVVQMEYFSPASGQFTERAIEPIGMLPSENNTQVVAYCQMQQDYRTFRLDRMSKVRISEEVFVVENRLTIEQYLRR